MVRCSSGNFTTELFELEGTKLANLLTFEVDGNENIVKGALAKLVSGPEMTFGLGSGGQIALILFWLGAAACGSRTHEAAAHPRRGAAETEVLGPCPLSIGLRETVLAPCQLIIG